MFETGLMFLREVDNIDLVFAKSLPVIRVKFHKFAELRCLPIHQNTFLLSHDLQVKGVLLFWPVARQNKHIFLMMNLQ